MISSSVKSCARVGALKAMVSVAAVVFKSLVDFFNDIPL